MLSVPRLAGALTLGGALLLIVQGHVHAEAPPPLLAGFAAADITPPVGFRMAGGYDEAVSERVVDPLFAKVCVFSQGETRVLLVVCDLCSIGREVSQPIREELARRTGVPLEFTSILATHTHGGPEYYGTLRDLEHELALEQRGADPREPIDYQALLRDRIGQAADAALQRQRAVQLSAGVVAVPGLAFNRRFHMRNGTVVFNPGKQNPDIVRPAGPVDDDLPILLFHDAATQQSTALVTTFAMHVATFGDGRSLGADFPGVLQQELQTAWGSEFLSLFFEGAAGDVNHIDVASGAPQDALTEHVRIGRRLATAVLSAAESLDPIPEPRLRAASRRVSVPLLESSPDEVSDSRTKLRDHLTGVRPLEFLDAVAAWRTLNNDRLRRRSGAARLDEELLAISLDRDTAIVCLPHEVFVELGMAIKTRSPFRRTLVFSLANDLDFYVPTQKAFSEGSYEVTTSSFQPGGGELLVDAATELLKQLAAHD